MLETGTIVDRFDGGGGKFDVGIVDLGEVGRGGLGREEEEEEGGFAEDHLADNSISVCILYERSGTNNNFLSLPRYCITYYLAVEG
mmetsp:Transcript_33195/g.60913  ORF Transcript_33195/g.60913 Transcript_33195/m.60913 type:complete len:86 (+) Transcript_33195:1449-1706(+)